MQNFSVHENYPQILKSIYEERAIVFRDRKWQASAPSHFTATLLSTVWA